MVQVECPNPSFRQMSSQFATISSRVVSSTSLSAISTHDRPQSQLDFWFLFRQQFCILNGCNGMLGEWTGPNARLDLPFVLVDKGLASGHNFSLY